MRQVEETCSPRTTKRTQADVPVLIEDRFFDQAEALRDQFEWRVSAVGQDSGERGLAYTTDERAFRFMAATADEIFSQEVLMNFLDRLRTWGKETLGVGHASSPQVQVYTKGCWRSIMRDDVRAQWHYLFSVKRAAECGTNLVKVLSEPKSGGRRWFKIALSRIAATELYFNQLLVHEAKNPYGVDVNPKCSTKPFEGAVFLDGYLW